MNRISAYTKGIRFEIEEVFINERMPCFHELGVSENHQLADAERGLFRTSKGWMVSDMSQQKYIPHSTTITQLKLAVSGSQAYPTPLRDPNQPQR